MKSILLFCFLCFSSFAWAQSVTISKMQGSCENSIFTYRADPVGFTAQSYSWEIVGQACGSCWSPVSYVYTLPEGSHQSGYVVKCTVTSTTGSTYSGTATISYTPTTTLSVGITIEPYRYPAIYCSDEVVFKATSNQTASFIWYKNGEIMASGSTYDPVYLYQGDIIRVVASSSDACVTGSPAESQLTVGNDSFFHIDEQVGTATVYTLDYPASRCEGSGESNFYAVAANAKTFEWSILPVNAGALEPSGTNLSSCKVIWSPSFSGNAIISAKGLGCGSDFQNGSFSYTVHELPLSPAFSDLTYCDFENIELKADPVTGVTSHNWFNPDNTPLGSGLTFRFNDLHPVGTYAFQVEAVNTFGCISPSRTAFAISVISSCDDKLNWIKATSYSYKSADQPGADPVQKIIGLSTSYFGPNGKLLQSQVKNLTNNEIFTSQAIEDKYGRPIIQTLSAPTGKTDFQYVHWFSVTQNNELFDHQHIDDPFASSQGTIGWYYSEQNSIEAQTPKTSYPYSRAEFYNDGSGDLKQSTRPGEAHRSEAGHKTLSGKFPVFNELNDYLTKRAIALPGIVQDGNLMNEGVQSVVRDENGRYALSISDKSGKAVMSARKGTSADHVLVVSNSISASGDPLSTSYRPLTYFYLLNDEAVTIEGSTDFVVEDIVNDITKSAGQTFANFDGKWPAGFYRITLPNATSTITLNYTNYFLDVSYQFYDDANHLRSSVSPNGFKTWKSSSTPEAAYGTCDKTTYKYNHQGWLLSMKELDAGETSYIYRRDGKIRFSQNAQQNEYDNDLNRVSGKGKFSYTLYDLLGRPVESGEYTGTQYSFATINGQAELANQLTYSVGDTKDWVKTFYDYPDADFGDITHLPNTYAQEFVRGSVAKTQNSNIQTWYSYDEFGRVTWMAQKPIIPAVASAIGNRVFVIKYTYDFLGNVLTVGSLSYDLSGNILTQFYHHYEYDDDQRLLKASTSIAETGEKKLRATYKYYLHGPLKRIELGDNIQGIDFVYNINGWLTHINHPDPTKDPGHDGNDVFGMILDYYESDLNNLFASNPNRSIHDPERIHRLSPELQNAYANHQPLIRFMPPDEELPAPSFKNFSAGNPAYKDIIKQRVNNPTNR